MIFTIRLSGLTNCHADDFDHTRGGVIFDRDDRDHVDDLRWDQDNVPEL